MSTFKVEKILNASTILVSPKWQINLGSKILSGDRVAISGLDQDPQNGYIEHRLKSFLIGKNVDLTKAIPTEESDSLDATITCSIILDGTDITYYFPEFTTRKKLAI